MLITKFISEQNLVTIEHNTLIHSLHGKILTCST